MLPENLAQQNKSDQKKSRQLRQGVCTLNVTRTFQLQRKGTEKYKKYTAQNFHLKIPHLPVDLPPNEHGLRAVGWEKNGSIEILY